MILKIFGKKMTKPDEEQKNDREYENFIKYYRRVKDGHFQCPVCDNQLANRQSLFSHFETMHADHKLPNYYKPHQSFHRRLITKYKAKSCAVCNADYSSLVKLKTHISNRHEIDIYDCKRESCPYTTVYRINLEKHRAECQF